MTDTLARLADAVQERYRIEREVGQGGMATVYLAHDLRHNRKVALKVLASELAALIGADRFLKEIEVTANLQHPHILPLFDSGVAQGPDGSRFLYYVMPYVEGETLRTRLQREKQLGVDEAVELAKSVAGALDYAHRRGVIHRDIKPENVLLHDGQAMLADFGIALAVREAGGTRLTGTGLSVGTPSYMSPEQAMGDRELDARSDVYSLGAMLYEMLAGEPPFTGSSAQAIVAKILTESAPVVTRSRTSVPGHVSAALQKALERLPADRFHSAGDFAAALGNPAFTVPSIAAAGHAGTRRSLWNPLSAVTTLVALAALLALAWLKLRPPPESPVRRLSLTTGPLGISFNRIALSPDGSGFVYTGQDTSGTVRLMSRPFGTLEASPLSGTEGAASPSFSPDGTRIAFLGTAPFAIKVAALNGAPATTVEGTGVIGGGVAWGADDWIYFDTGSSLDRIRSSGDLRETVVKLDSAAGEVGFAWPEPLPNGTGLLFRSRRAGEPTTAYTISALDLTTRTRKVLVQGLVARYTASGHLLYVTADGVLLAAPFDQDRMALTGPARPLAEGLGVSGFGAVDLAVSRSGDLMYVSTNTRGGSRPMWVARDGTSEVVDPAWDIGPETLIDWSLSGDGKRLAVTIGTRGGGIGTPSDLWVKELDRGPLSKVTFGGNNWGPVWSADGKSLYYVAAPASDPNVAGRLFRIRADGSGTPEPLPSGPRAINEIAVSPRDGWVVVATDPSTPGAGDLLAFRPGLDTVLTPLLESPTTESAPAISPDGRWLAYTSMESGRFEVYLRPFPNVNQGKWQVSLDGGLLPKWAHRGGELFFATRLGPFMSAEIGTTPTLTVGRRQLLYNSSTPAPAPFFDLAPDDRRTIRLWAAAGADSARTEVVLVQNFLAELRARR